MTPERADFAAAIRQNYGETVHLLPNLGGTEGKCLQSWIRLLYFFPRATGFSGAKHTRGDMSMQNDHIVRQEGPKFPYKVSFVGTPEKNVATNLSRELEAMLDDTIISAVAPAK